MRQGDDVFGFTVKEIYFLEIIMWTFWGLHRSWKNEIINLTKFDGGEFRWEA